MAFERTAPRNRRATCKSLFSNRRSIRRREVIGGAAPDWAQRLKHDAIPGSTCWPIVICRPGPDPLESLVVALSRTVNVGQGALALSELIAEFQKNEKTLHLIARQPILGNAPEQRLVILLDQFEEVFTLCRNEELREALIRNLLSAAKVAQGQTLVILTVCADFYGKRAANAELAAASDHHVLVGPMTEDELRRAIEMPTVGRV